jgi:hypothetical protein
VRYQELNSGVSLSFKHVWNRTFSGTLAHGIEKTDIFQPLTQYPSISTSSRRKSNIGFSTLAPLDLLLFLYNPRRWSSLGLDPMFCKVFTFSRYGGAGEQVWQFIYLGTLGWWEKVQPFTLAKLPEILRYQEGSEVKRDCNVRGGHVGEGWRHTKSFRDLATLKKSSLLFV